MDLIDDDPVAQVTGSMPSAAGSSSTSLSAVAGGLRSTASGGSSKLGVDYSTGFGTVTSTVETDAIMKEIGKREVKIRNR